MSSPLTPRELLEDALADLRPILERDLPPVIEALVRAAEAGLPADVIRGLAVDGLSPAGRAIALLGVVDRHAERAEEIRARTETVSARLEDLTRALLTALASAAGQFGAALGQRLVSSALQRL